MDFNDDTSNADRRPLFARGGKKELRQDIDEEILNVLDAISLARDMTRSDLVTEILGQYVRQRLHERDLIDRVLRSNPPISEVRGGTKVAAAA